MADDKNAAAPHEDPFRDIVFAIIVLFLVSYFVNALVRTIHSSRIFSLGWRGLTPHGIFLSHTRPISSLANPIGARVGNTNSSGVDVYNSAGGRKIGAQNSEAKGVIVQGPVDIYGERYWYVDYDSGTDGWVKEKDIAYVESDSISSRSKPTGERVLTVRNTAVVNGTGTEEVGSQRAGVRGTIERGPNIIDGERYWRVDFDSGTDGWVRESDLGYLEHKPTVFERLILGLYSGIRIIQVIAVIVAILALIALMYYRRAFMQIRHEEKGLLYPPVVAVETKQINPKWQRVIDHVESTNENDWRLSILEADILLDDLLDTLGLPGDTMGDKLKAVNKGDFQTIDNAWEAHKVRNQIAHEGSDFVLTQREARRIVELYRAVFEEFKVI